LAAAFQVVIVLVVLSPQSTRKLYVPVLSRGNVIWVLVDVPALSVFHVETKFAFLILTLLLPVETIGVPLLSLAQTLNAYWAAAVRPVILSEVLAAIVPPVQSTGAVMPAW
jgi:hypothetical protein